MANIFPDSNTGQWTYSNTTRVADDAFTFHSVGAYVKVTVTGEEAGLSGGNLYIRGVVSHPQSLRCRIDFYVPPVVSANPMEIEKHFVYLHADDNGVINQEVVITSGRYGYFDHIDIQLEATLDVGENIELTSFVIDDPSLSELLKVAEEIEENLTENMSEELASLNEYANALSGLYTTEITQPGGAKVIYAHDHPYIEQSDFIAIQTAGAYAWTNTGWNGGSPVWQYGVDQTGNAIFRLISTVGLNANWIKTGRVESFDGNTYFDLDTAEIAGENFATVDQMLTSADFEQGSISLLDGQDATSTQYGRSDYIAITADEYVNTSGTLYTVRLFFYDKDKVFIVDDAPNVMPPTGAEFVRLRLFNGGVNYSTWRGNINGTISAQMRMQFILNPDDGLSLMSGDDIIMTIKDKNIFAGRKITFPKVMAKDSGDLINTRTGRLNSSIIFENPDESVPNAVISVVDMQNIMQYADPNPRMNLTVWGVAGELNLRSSGTVNSNAIGIRQTASNIVSITAPDITLDGTLKGGSREATSVGGANANSLINEWSYISNTATNAPSANYYWIHTVSTDTGHKNQIAYMVNGVQIHRRYYNYSTSTWSAWSRIDN